MQAPTLEYVTRLGTCWSAAQLQTARQGVPMPDPPTWSGFLGARLNGLEKPLVLLRVVVAMQHVSHQKIPLANGEGAGQAFKRAKAMALPELLTFAETLGVYLDTDPQPATAKTHDGD